MGSKNTIEFSEVSSEVWILELHAKTGSLILSNYVVSNRGLQFMILFPKELYHLLGIEIALSIT